MGPLIAVDAEGADAELDVGLDAVDRAGQVTDQSGDIVPPPVALRGKGGTIAAVGLVVIEGLPGYRIGVEVVVKVDPVHIVAGDDVAHHLAGVGAHLWEAGIEEQLLAVADKPLGMLAGGVPRGDGGADVGDSAVGIDPGVELDEALVADLDHKGKRVPEWLRCPTLLSGEEAAPRLIG